MQIFWLKEYILGLILPHVPTEPTAKLTANDIINWWINKKCKCVWFTYLFQPFWVHTEIPQSEQAIDFWLSGLSVPHFSDCDVTNLYISMISAEWIFPKVHSYHSSDRFWETSVMTIVCPSWIMEFCTALWMICRALLKQVHNVVITRDWAAFKLRDALQGSCCGGMPHCWSNRGVSAHLLPQSGTVSVLQSEQELTGNYHDLLYSCLI